MTGTRILKMKQRDFVEFELEVFLDNYNAST